MFLSVTLQWRGEIAKKTWSNDRVDSAGAMVPKRFFTVNVDDSVCVCVCLPCLVRGICAVICTDRRTPPGSDKRTAQEEAAALAAAKKHEHQNLPAQHNSPRGAQATEPLAYCSIQSVGVCAVCEARFTKEKRTHALGDVVKVMEKREGPEKRRNKYYAR